MTGGTLRRLQELAAVMRGGLTTWRATKEANLAAACQSAIGHSALDDNHQLQPPDRVRRAHVRVSGGCSLAKHHPSRRPSCDTSSVL
jgi:hypothetical protein